MTFNQETKDRSQTTDSQTGVPSSEMKRAFTIFVGFIHDFAAGCWVATVLAIYWIHRKATPPGLEDFFLGLKKEFFYLGLVCVGIVILSGIGRTFTYAYIGNVYGETSEKLRRRMLIIKHIILFSVFGAGIYWQYLMVYR